MGQLELVRNIRVVLIDSDRAVAASIAGTEMPGYIQSFAIFGTLHDYPLPAGAFYGILQDEDLSFLLVKKSGVYQEARLKLQSINK